MSCQRFEVSPHPEQLSNGALERLQCERGSVVAAEEKSNEVNQGSINGAELLVPCLPLDGSKG